MGCDYRIISQLVIHYLDKTGKMSVIYTDTNEKKVYISEYEYGYDSDDDDYNTLVEKYNKHLKKIIEENTYDKILFDEERWLEESYKKKYENRIIKQFDDISKLLKVYKRVYCWD